MATRSVTFTFINEDGLERTRTMIQDVPNFVQDPPPPPPIEDPEPLPSPEDIFLDNPIQLPIVPLDFSDIQIDLSDMDFNFGLGALGETKIGPIFAPGGGTTIQGWNNGDPSNNWGMGVQSIGGTVPISKDSVPKIKQGVVIPPTSQQKESVTTKQIVSKGSGRGSGSGRGAGR